MNESIIEGIYAKYVNTAEYAKIHNECEDTKNSVTAYSKLVRECGDSEILVNAATEYEKYGFKMGFKFAMRLRDECKEFSRPPELINLDSTVTKLVAAADKLQLALDSFENDFDDFLENILPEEVLLTFADMFDRAKIQKDIASDYANKIRKLSKIIDKDVRELLVK